MRIVADGFHRGALRNGEALVDVQSRRPNEPAEITLRRHSALHLVPLLRQDQPAPPIPAHIHGRLAATGVAHHHLFLRLMEYRTIYPRLLRLQPRQRFHPESCAKMPGQFDDLVYCGGNQYHHRFHRFPPADTTYQFVAAAHPSEVPVDHGVLSGLLVSFFSDDSLPSTFPESQNYHTNIKAGERSEIGLQLECLDGHRAHPFIIRVSLTTVAWDSQGLSQAPCHLIPETPIIHLHLCFAFF